jgi:hypothetical protein
MDKEEKWTKLTKTAIMSFNNYLGKIVVEGYMPPEEKEELKNYKNMYIRGFLLGFDFCKQKTMYECMQYYMEYCEKNGYVTPQWWYANKRHFSAPDEYND